MKVKLTIQEIVSDYYSLAEKEGFISGLAEGYILTNNDKKIYHNFMKELMNKYLPNWKTKIGKKYWEDAKEEDDKGLILSGELNKNFKNIFYQLV